MKHKAKTLEDAAKEGYRFEQLTDELWYVYNPDGVQYAVWPKEARCSCPAMRTCKHLRFTWALEKLFDLRGVNA